MLSDLLTRTVTIIHRSSSGDTDAYGDDLETETTTTTVGELQQTARLEPSGQGELSDTTWLLILPAGTLLTTSSAVVVDEHVYELVGDPWPARNPLTGDESHVEATVRRTRGTDEAGS